MTRPFRGACSAVYTIICLLTVHAVCAEEMRTWTDSTGKYKVEAEFVEILDGKVRLKGQDGKVMSLPLAKLCDEDRTYLKEAQRRRREGDVPQVDPNDPFANSVETPGAAGRSGAPRGLPGGIGGRLGGMRGRRAGGFGDDEVEFQVGDKVEVREFGNWLPGAVIGLDPQWNRVFVKLAGSDRTVQAVTMNMRLYDPNSAPPGDDALAALAPVDMSSIRRIVALGGAGGKFQPDPAPSGGPGWTPQPVGLSPKAGFFEKVVGMSFAGPGARAVVARQGGADAMDDRTRLEVLDLKGGRTVGAMAAPRNMKLLAVSPTGQRLLTVSDVATSHHGPVQLWEIGDKQLTLVKSWQATTDAFRQQLTWLGWVDDEHVMTIDGNGLIVWSVTGPKGEYSIGGSGMQAPAFSPGGKQFAVGTDQGFSIHDAATGALLTKIALDKRASGRQVAFSPSGQLLACTGSSTVEIYDCATGQKVTGAYAPAAEWPNAALCWLDEEHVLVGGSNVIHLPSQMMVWNYRHNAASVVPLAGRVWYVFDGGPRGGEGALLPFQLPHEAVKPVADSDLVLQPGDPVVIETELMVSLQGPGGAAPTSADEQLKQAVTDAGFLVALQSEKRLIARSMPGEAKEVEYRAFGAPWGQTQKTSYTQQVFELELMVGGQSVWKRSRVQDAPYHLQLQENESVDAAVQRTMQTDTGFFRSTLPSRVMPTAMEEARVSTLSINGIE